MFTEILKDIEGIAAYPLFSLFIFVPFFVGVCVMVLRMRKDHADRMSQLPLED
jgi:cytochrome c oxidase cbb3-type subunit 4